MAVKRKSVKKSIRKNVGSNKDITITITSISITGPKNEVLSLPIVKKSGTKKTLGTGGRTCPMWSQIVLTEF